MDFCLFQPSTLTHFLSSPPTLISIFLPLKIELKIYTSLPCLHSLRPIRFDIMGTAVTIRVILLHHRARKVVYKKFFELWLAVEPLMCSPFTAYLPFCYHSPNSFQSRYLFHDLPDSLWAAVCVLPLFLPVQATPDTHWEIYTSLYMYCEKYCESVGRVLAYLRFVDVTTAWIRKEEYWLYLLFVDEIMVIHFEALFISSSACLRWILNINVFGSSQ